VYNTRHCKRYCRGPSVATVPSCHKVTITAYSTVHPTNSEQNNTKKGIATLLLCHGLNRHLDPTLVYCIPSICQPHTFVHSNSSRAAPAQARQETQCAVLHRLPKLWLTKVQPTTAPVSTGLVRPLAQGMIIAHAHELAHGYIPMCHPHRHTAILHGITTNHNSPFTRPHQAFPDV
jgi:hypothetical protein